MEYEGIEYEVKWSNRRTLSLEINRDGKVIIRAPFTASGQQVMDFFLSHREWIAVKMLEREERRKRLPCITPDMETELREKAKRELPPLVQKYAAQMDVQPTKITVTGASRRFGSCSAKNAICFSWRLMAYPQAAIEYVVVHELAHILHHDHSPAFYRAVEKVLPDYKEREKLFR